MMLVLLMVNSTVVAMVALNLLDVAMVEHYLLDF